MMDSIITLLNEGVRRIWCYRRLAVAVMVVTFGAGAAFIACMPNMYEAWGQVFVSKQTPLSAATEGVSLVGQGYGSPYVVQKTLLNDQNLEAVIRLRNPAAAGFDTVTMARAVAELRSHLRAPPDQGDGFVEFHYADTDAVRARDTVQLLLDQFIEQNIARSQKDLGEAQGFLDDQIDAYGRMLADNEAQLAQLERQYPALAVVATASLPAAVEPPAAPATAEPPAARPPAAPPPLRRPALRSAVGDKVASLEAKLDSLRSQYTDQYPDVVAVRRELAQAKAEQELETRLGAPSDLTAPSPAAVGDHQAAARPSSRARRVTHLPAPPALITAKWTDLRRNHEILRTDYQQLLSRREATRMSRAVYANDRSGKYLVTRRPTIPVRPSGPKRPLYLAAAALAAVAAGLGAAYLMARSRGILVSPRELEQAFQLPVVGTVALERAWQTEPARRLLPSTTRRRPAREPLS
jgi:uncharacterized protein involved in exopolysaccharide biosynthesis